MADKSEVLATIEAKLNQAIQRKKPREQVRRILKNNIIFLIKKYLYLDSQI